MLGAALGGSLSPQGHTCTLQVACGYAGAMEKERWHAQLTEAIQAAKRERQGRTALPMSFKDRPLHWTCKQAIATGKILPIVFNEMQIKVMMFYYFPVITGNMTKNDTSITAENLRDIRNHDPGEV